jgi:predicted nucleic acid-binding protein
MTQMRIMLDTNILLDAMLAREPFVHEASKLFALAERSVHVGIMAAISVPTIHYVVSRSVGPERAFQAVERLLRLFDVASVSKAELVVERTEGRPGAAPVFGDYEDGVVHAAAVSARCSGIVTRDASGFAASTLAVYTPAELLAALG